MVYENICKLNKAANPFVRGQNSRQSADELRHRLIHNIDRAHKVRLRIAPFRTKEKLQYFI